MGENNSVILHRSDRVQKKLPSLRFLLNNEVKMKHIIYTRVDQVIRNGATDYSINYLQRTVDDYLLIMRSNGVSVNGVWTF